MLLFHLFIYLLLLLLDEFFLSLSDSPEILKSFQFPFFSYGLDLKRFFILGN